MNTSFIPDSDQQRVIDIEEGDALVFAPPGCGKTQILTLRLQKALLNGVRPQDMLCLTFTNRAARGMLERIQSNIDLPQALEVFVGNVHRYCSKFLFEENIIPAGSSIIDDDDAISILSGYLEEEEQGVSRNPTLRRSYFSCVQLAAFIFQLKSNHPKELRLHPDCITADDVTALRYLCQQLHIELSASTMIDIFDHSKRYADALDNPLFDYGMAKLLKSFFKRVDIANYYASYKDENQLYDFEDLLMLTYNAYTSPSANEYRHYSWVQIDEVQDLNALQLAIVDAITTKEQRSVVYLGDEQQAIFSFMGAKLSTLSLLKERCKGHIYHLHTNHRAPSYLVKVLNTFAQHQLHIAPELLPSTLKETPQTGDELKIITSGTLEEELRDTALLAQKLLNDHPNETTSIIVSSNADADKISEELNTQHIPHFKVSGQDLSSTPLIKLLIAHLGVIANEHNFISWSRILKGLKIFTTNAASQRFVRLLNERAISVSDLLNDAPSTYVERFVRHYEQDILVVFDTETTGLNVLEDDIVQIAAVKITKGKVLENERFEIFIDTKRPIPAMLGDIENPLIEEMKNHTLHAPAEALARFMDYIDGALLVGHNATFDYQILYNNLLRYLPQYTFLQKHSSYIDTLKLTRLLQPSLKNYKLKNLLQEFRLEGQNTHLADADVHATVGLVHFCYQQSVEKLKGQSEFLAHPKVDAKVQKLKRLYGDIYRQAQQELWKKQETEQQSALVSQLVWFYNQVVEAEIMKPLSATEYVFNYIENEIVDKHEENCLAQQLFLHVNEIATLKEADLCGSSIIHEKIFISTIHKAKGLEFDNVIVYDVAEGRYPNYFIKDNPELVLEDARKFYVALSRARKRLWMIYASSKIGYYNNPTPRYLTRFMNSIASLFSS